MTVLVAVTPTPEGAHALLAGKEEAERLGTTLLVLNLSLTEFAPSELAKASDADVLDRAEPAIRDQRWPSSISLTSAPTSNAWSSGSNVGPESEKPYSGA